MDQPSTRVLFKGQPERVGRTDMGASRKRAISQVAGKLVVRSSLDGFPIPCAPHSGTIRTTQAHNRSAPSWDKPFENPVGVPRLYFFGGGFVLRCRCRRIRVSFWSNRRVPLASKPV